MALLPQTKWADLKECAELRNFPSMEVLDNEGNYIATLIIPAILGGATVFDHTKNMAESLGQSSNSVLPPSDRVKVPLEVRNNDGFGCLECSFIAKSGFGLMAHHRRHKRERVKV